MPEITVSCDMCSGTGDATHGDQHASTNMDRCRKCGGEGKIPARSGESRETSWPWAVPGAQVEGMVAEGTQR